MQQFTVPQFIDVEDKIMGPITVRQFIIMLSGFVFIGLGYKFFDFSLFLFNGILIFGVSGIFAFLKINGMPFHYFVLNFIQTLKKPSLRVWNNRLNLEYETEEQETKIAPETSLQKPKLVTTSRLAELSLVVDTKGVYRGEENNNKEIKITASK
jgi:hypothetical protein